MGERGREKGRLSRTLKSSGNWLVTDQCPNPSLSVGGFASGSVRRPSSIK